MRNKIVVHSQRVGSHEGQMFTSFHMPVLFGIKFLRLRLKICNMKSQLDWRGFRNELIQGKVYAPVSD